MTLSREQTLKETLNRYNNLMNYKYALARFVYASPSTRNLTYDKTAEVRNVNLQLSQLSALSAGLSEMSDAQFDSKVSLSAFPDPDVNPAAFELLVEAISDGAVLQVSDDYKIGLVIGSGITNLDSVRHWATGVVMMPSAVSGGATVDDIKRLMSGFMIRTQVLDPTKQYDIDVNIVESYITTVPKDLGNNPIPVGSWVLTLQINDNSLWQYIVEQLQG